MANDSTFIVNGLRIPWGMISEEVEGLYSSTILSEFRDIIGYYDTMRMALHLHRK